MLRPSVLCGATALGLAGHYRGAQATEGDSVKTVGIATQDVTRFSTAFEGRAARSYSWPAGD